MDALDSRLSLRMYLFSTLDIDPVMGLYCAVESYKFMSEVFTLLPTFDLIPDFGQDLYLCHEMLQNFKYPVSAQDYRCIQFLSHKLENYSASCQSLVSSFCKILTAMQYSYSNKSGVISPNDKNRLRF